jgi:uncharacterized ion transporter superfamily protein YfcC
MENASTGANTKATYHDWKEERRRWRQERREARRHYPWRGIFPGLLLILIGGLFLAVQQSWIPQNTWWEYLLIGLGGIAVITGLVRQYFHDYRYRGAGQFVMGAILITLGALFLLGSGHWWPLVLIVVGATVFLRLWW